MNRRWFLAGMAAAACGQTSSDIPFTCPMDPEVRSNAAGRCPRCGMKLVAGIPDAREFVVHAAVQPATPQPGQPVTIVFDLRDPKEARRARLQIIHEKLLHLFVVSADLTWFAHEHPELQADGTFLWRGSFPHTGEYRLLCDFYPEQATPQMIARTVYVPGPSHRAELTTDMSEKQGENLRVRLRTEPAQPLAGSKTMLFFSPDPADGLQPWLGAWGHMLAASADLIDIIHTHPAWEDRSDTIQFNLIFPRPGMHRVWVQFQRENVVNTVAFTVPVAAI